MEAAEKINITVEVTIQASIEKVWSCWNRPEHITQWNKASDGWHTPHSTNDFRVGGKFSSRMEAKDGSFGFDFWGVYNEVKTNQLLIYTLGDGRKVSISFNPDGKSIKVTETFEAEEENSIELQKIGWQAILDNFKKYTEASNLK